MITIFRHLLISVFTVKLSRKRDENPSAESESGRIQSVREGEEKLRLSVASLYTNISPLVRTIRLPNRNQPTN